MYSPYTNECFDDFSESHIEHIVSVSEAHDSGLCAADKRTKRFFASDISNLTLASPSVNYSKSNKDAGEWLPSNNRCWYVKKVIRVKRKYGLSIDANEHRVLRTILRSCSWGGAYLERHSCPEYTRSRVTIPIYSNALEMYDDNGNGRITCAEAKAHGIAPVHSDHPAYAYMSDRDGDGVVCE